MLDIIYFHKILLIFYTGDISHKRNHHDVERLIIVTIVVFIIYAMAVAFIKLKE